MNHLPEIFAVSAALTFAVVWLLGTYRSRCLRDPLDELPPVKRNKEEWRWHK